MSRLFPEKLRNLVAERAKFRCEYCRLHEDDSAMPFHLDHIVSLKHRGETKESNLAYSCPDCNFYKGSDLGTYLTSPPETLIRFFNPRTDIWEEHFEIERGHIAARTAVGEATMRVLNFNSIERIIIRQVLMGIERYP